MKVNRGTIFLWISLLALLHTPTSAQRRPRARAAAPRQDAQAARAQRERDEEEIRRMPDPGVDFAIVTADSAIREEPGNTGRLLVRAKRGELVALVEREPADGWYNVIHVDTGTEGWANSANLVVRFTTRPRPGPVMQAERTGTYDNPEIIIKNDSYKDLNLKVAGQNYAVPSYTQKAVSLVPGRYKFHAYAPGVMPLFGEHDFEVGHNYTWTFFIRSVRR